MSFLDKIKERASVVRGAAGGVAQNAVKQTKTLAAVGKTKVAIASEEDKAKKAYTELGRLYYRDYAAGVEAVMEEYQPWIDQIADANAQIERLNEELAAAKAPAEDPNPVEEAEEAVEAVEEAVEEAAEAEEEVVVEFVEDALEAAEESVTEEPPVDTLYIDVTNTEE